MRYIIKENRISDVIDLLIKERYGEPLEMEEDDDYLYFYSPSNKRGKGNNEPFERNAWGMLWVNDYILYKKIRNFLGLKNKEVKEYLKQYFEEKYGVKIKDVSSENSSFFLPGEEDDDSDPWFDDNDDDDGI